MLGRLPVAARGGHVATVSSRGWPRIAPVCENPRPPCTDWRGPGLNVMRVWWEATSRTTGKPTDSFSFHAPVEAAVRPNADLPRRPISVNVVRTSVSARDDRVQAARHSDIGIIEACCWNF
jgi:hypothetical protein